MARLNLAEAESMGSNGGERINWFQLDEDGQVARVRILANTVDDLDVFSLHRIALGNGERYINCLRTHEDDPIEKCPLCQDGKIRRASPRVFLQLLNVDDGKVYVWDRGIQIITKLRSVERRIQGPLYQTVIEIERNGRKGDQHTTYEFYPTSSRDSTLTLEQLPPRFDLENSGFIMNENADSIRTYLRTGDFPGWGVNAEQQPQQNNYNSERQQYTPRPSYGGQQSYRQNNYQNTYQGQGYEQPRQYEAHRTPEEKTPAYYPRRPDAQNVQPPVTHPEPVANEVAKSDLNNAQIPGTEEKKSDTNSAPVSHPTRRMF